MLEVSILHNITKLNLGHTPFKSLYMNTSLNAFKKLKREFPFPGYIKSPDKYVTLFKYIKEFPPDSKILDLGCGPCDVSAFMALLGYNVTGIDDLQDQWHLIGKNRQRIMKFSERLNVELVTQDLQSYLKTNTYDVVLNLDVIEHLHNSPREMLNGAINSLRTDGKIIIATPNAAWLYNRIRLLAGKEVNIQTDFLYWNVGKYRSHTKEYTRTDLHRILIYQNLVKIEIKMHNIAIKPTSGIISTVYDIVSNLYPNWRDTIIASGYKPDGWRPTETSILIFKNYYRHLSMYNLDSESDRAIEEKIIGLPNGSTYL